MSESTSTSSSWLIYMLLIRLDSWLKLGYLHWIQFRRETTLAFLDLLFDNFYLALLHLLRDSISLKPILNFTIVTFQGFSRGRNPFGNFINFWMEKTTLRIFLWGLLTHFNHHSILRGLVLNPCVVQTVGCWNSRVRSIWLVEGSF